MSRTAVRSLLAATALLLAGSAAGCDLVGVGDDAMPALIVGVLADEPVLSVPTTVTVGEDFVVRVESYGLSGCWRKGETRRSVEGLEASVRPFDHEPSGEQACSGHIPVFTHEATLRFQETGTAHVVISGRSLEDRAPVSFTREVTVTGAAGASAR